MPKTWELLSLNEVGHYEDRASTREEYSLKISDYKKTKAKILTAITADDGSALSRALNNSFIYRVGTRVYQKTYQGGHHTKHWDKKYCLVRPRIEALFFDRLFELKDILQALDGKPKLKEIFVSVCLDSTNSIPKQVFKPLEEASVSALRAEIAKLRQQFPTLTDLATDLTNCLNTMPSSNEDGVTQLAFKLRFLETLHGKDNLLAQDKNYRCIIVNVAMILLGFIPNLILGLATGNFLFFKHTPKQASIARMGSHFGLFKPAADSSDLQRCPDDAYVASEPRSLGPIYGPGDIRRGYFDRPHYDNVGFGLF